MWDIVRKCPAKSDEGRSSKISLDKYIPILRNKISLKLWSNIEVAVNWFNKIESKDKYIFFINRFRQLLFLYQPYFSN